MIIVQELLGLIPVLTFTQAITVRPFISDFPSVGWRLSFRHKIAVGYLVSLLSLLYVGWRLSFRHKIAVCYLVSLLSLLSLLLCRLEA